MKQKVIVTIDTEGHKGSDPIDKLIWGNTKDGKFGIERIMDEFEKIGARILFFLDFAEAWDYGKDNVKDVADCILSRGHDIGVHIHPDHMADRSRLFLWEYTYEEQEQIIKKCTDLYEKIVGRKPLSFRAGKYGANRDTLEILSNLGYRYDFSEYYGQKWCGITPAITVNSPVKYRNLVEFPVTMHRSLKFLSYSRYDKIDVESMLPGELRYALDQVTRQEFPVVVTLFLHSFSLMEWAQNPDNPVSSTEKINKLQEAIQSIAGNDSLEVIGEADLEAITPVDEKKAQESMICWQSLPKGVYYSYQKLKFIARRNRKARILLLIVWIVMILVCMCCIAGILKYFISN